MCVASSLLSYCAEIHLHAFHVLCFGADVLLSQPLWRLELHKSIFRPEYSGYVYHPWPAVRCNNSDPARGRASSLFLAYVRSRAVKAKVNRAARVFTWPDAGVIGLSAAWRKPPVLRQTLLSWVVTEPPLCWAGENSHPNTVLLSWWPV